MLNDAGGNNHSKNDKDIVNKEESTNDNKINIDLNIFEKKDLICKTKRSEIYVVIDKKKISACAAKIYSPNSPKSNNGDISKLYQIISRLIHPSIFQLIGFSPIDFDGNPNPVIITKIAPNGKLSKLLSNERTSHNLKWTNTKKLINIYGIASGMKYLHSQNIIHRKLQPSSILLDEQFHPIITNFDFLKKLNDVNTPTNSDIFGKPAYIAPEVWTNKLYSKSSDVYAFSMILYEILSNENPLNEFTSINKLMNEVVVNDYRPKFNKSIPKCYQELIESCWSKDRQKRPEFSEIVHLLKTDKRFILDNISIYEYCKYKSFFDKYDSDCINKMYLNLPIDSNFRIDSNRFVVIDKIGQEAYAKIYIVKDNQTGEKCIAKVIKKHSLDLNDENLYSSFIDEVNTYKELNHPLFPKFFGYSTTFTKGNKIKNRLTLFIEYIKNGSLYNILDMERSSKTPNEWDDTIKLINIYGIASGMEYLHSLDILHRDLKSKNILEDEHFFPKIIDFGISIKSHQIKKTSYEGYNYVGTPIYIAPEIWENVNYSKASDIYSFALVMYEIVTGNKLWNEKNIFTIMISVLDGKRPEFKFPISISYRRLIEMCWSSNFEKRPTFTEITQYLKNNILSFGNINVEKFLNYVDLIENYSSYNIQQYKKEFNKFVVEYDLPSKSFIIPPSIKQIDLHKYYKSKKIGEGSFSQVYKVGKLESNYIFAAKIMNLKLDYLNEKDIIYFSREISILSSVNYPAIVSFVGYSKYNFKNEERPVILTEIYENGNLKDYIELERRGLAIPEWNDTKKFIIIYGIALGMKYLHANSIIHRDLKPENILLDCFLYPKITDFGLSKFLDSTNAGNNSGYCGTLLYSAPEVLLSNDYTKACDVYSFSLIVYEIITTEIPYKNIDIFKFYTKIDSDEYPSFDFPIPDCYRNLIELCWSHDKNNRPSFDKIVNMLKSDPNFLINVNIDEVKAYSELFGEEFLFNQKDNVCMNPKNDLEPIYNVNISEKIDKSTISMFNQLFEIENKDFSNRNYLLNLYIFTQKETILKGKFNKIIKVDYWGKVYAAQISRISMNLLSKYEMQIIIKELNKISKVNHLSILKFIGLSPTNFHGEPNPVIITEMLPDISLNKILKYEKLKKPIKEWDLTKKLIVIYGIASGMKCLHSNNILHRNLKVENIYLDKSFHPKIADYGLLSHLLITNSIAMQSSTTFLYEGVNCTPEFLKEYTKASDVYLFALLIYEIFTFESQFDYISNFKQIYDRIIINEKRPSLNKQIPECFKILIEKCWSQDPEKRPTFDEIVENMKNDQSFILPEVDKHAFRKYIHEIDMYEAKLKVKKSSHRAIKE